MKINRHVRHFLFPQRSNNHRPELLKPVVLFLLSFISFICIYFSKDLYSYIFTPHGIVLGQTSDIRLEEIVALTNSERQKQGLDSLTFNSQLARAAEAKAQDMFEKQYWAHVSPQGKQPWAFISEADYSYVIAGENLARDFQHSDEVIKAWLASPTHRANILHHRYKEIGVAVVEGELEGLNTTLVVQMFGTPNSTEKAQEQTVTVIPTTQISPEAALQEQPVVLAGQSARTTALERPIIISPIAVVKAVFLAILLIIVTTLLYDFVIASHTHAVRVVGKNMAHVFLFLTVIYLLLYYKGGFVL